MKYRINKFIAEAGICSRRSADDLIRSGKIKLNKKTHRELGTLIDDETDIVLYQNQRISISQKKIYILFNKPANCVCSNRSQDKKTKTIYDFLPKINERLFSIGRLDKDTTGILLVTNDGDLSHKLMHPNFKVEKEYKLVAKGAINRSKLEKLRTGIQLEDGKTLPAGVYLNKKVNDFYHIKMIIKEGKNRQIKRMISAIDAKVMKLHRSKFAHLSTKKLQPGEWRYLTFREIQSLRKLIEKKSNQTKPNGSIQKKLQKP